MRKFVVLGCALALVAGCAGKAPPVKSSLPAKAPSARNLDKLSIAELGALSDAASPAVQTKIAERWADKLQSSNASTVSDATAALGALGDYGYPHLVKGLESPSDELRIASMKSMHVSNLVKHQNETLPILVAMLRDPNPSIRGAAVSRLPWYGKAAGKYLQFVQAMARTDPDANVRVIAAVAVNGLYEATTGKTMTGGPNDPKIP
jgi:hypothetical protein